MYIELEHDFKCRLIELFHYILRELLFEQNCKSTLLDFLFYSKQKCIIIKIREKNCKGNKLNKSIDVREMYEYLKGLRSTCSFLLTIFCRTI